MLPQGFRVPERRAEKSRSPCAMGSVDAVGATGLLSGRPSVPGSANPVGERVAFAWGTVSRVIEAGTGLAGVGMCARGATSPSSRVTAGSGSAR
jgi:hypothetical protein